MKTYTIDQIRIYLQSQESFGDVLYNLSEENIDKALAFNQLLESDEETEDYDDFDH